MTYGAEAMIPVETGLPTELFQVGKNDQLLYKHLDLIDENRDNTVIKLANYD